MTDQPDEQDALPEEIMALAQALAADGNLITEENASSVIEPDPAPVEAEAPAPEQDWAFPEESREDFTGLMFLGALQDTFEWLGHTFVIRTITTNEAIEVGLIHKRYRGSLAEVKAYQAACVAACVVSVDGKELPMPISTRADDSPVENRLRVVLDWYPTTIDTVYDAYLSLESRAVEVMNAMGEATG